MSNELFNLAKLFFGENTTGSTSSKYNLIKKDGDLKIELVLPGFKKEDISLESEGNKLIIKAKSSKEDEDKNQLYVWKEFQTQNYEQTLVLPRDFNYDSVNATYESGILSINLQSVPKIFNRIDVK